MTERVVRIGAEGKFPVIQRSLPRKRPGDGRTIKECAVAAQMLLKLQRGDDLRHDRIHRVRDAIVDDHLDHLRTPGRALDRILDDIEALT